MLCKPARRVCPLSGSRAAGVTGRFPTQQPLAHERVGARPNKAGRGPVPRYYLHIGELDTDLEGAELADLAAARAEVLLAAREMLAEAIFNAREDIPLRFLITNGEGEVLETVNMRE